MFLSKSDPWPVPGVPSYSFPLMSTAEGETNYSVEAKAVIISSPTGHAGSGSTAHRPGFPGLEDQSWVGFWVLRGIK